MSTTLPERLHTAYLQQQKLRYDAAQSIRFLQAAVQTGSILAKGRAAILALQKKRLENVVKAAIHAPIYHERVATLRSFLSSSGFAQHSAHHSAWTGITPIDKKTLAQDWSKSFSRRHREAPHGLLEGDVPATQALRDWIQDPHNAGTLFQERLLVATTSGTTGERGIFTYSAEDWAAARAITFARVYRSLLLPRRILGALYERPQRMAFLVGGGGHFMASLLVSYVPKLAYPFVKTLKMPIDLPFADVVKQLEDFQPHTVHTYATVLPALCAAQQDGKLHINPYVFTVGSESLGIQMRTQMQQVFPTSELVETYAATECPFMASSCSHGHLHINEDACILEAVDAEHRPVPDGEWGEHVLLTNLVNMAQPLLRYVLSDRIRIIPVDGPQGEPCLCGSPLSRIEVEGRSDDVFYWQDGVGRWQMHPPIPLELLFLRLAGIKQFQLIHERQNHLLVRLVVETGQDADVVCMATQRALAHYLAEHALAESVFVRVAPQTTPLARTAGGKLRQIYSEVIPSSSIRAQAKPASYFRTITP